MIRLPPSYGSETLCGEIVRGKRGKRGKERGAAREVASPPVCFHASIAGTKHDPSCRDRLFAVRRSNERAVHVPPAKRG